MKKALYRKYRPTKLSELVGQEEAVSLIKNQIEKDNLGHAYLFSGPRGVGKTSLARIIATQLGCDPIFDVSETWEFALSPQNNVLCTRLLHCCEKQHHK